MGQVRVVGIRSCCGLDGVGIESWLGRDCLHPVSHTTGTEHLSRE
jgi:hypothetical protein